MQQYKCIWPIPQHAKRAESGKGDSSLAATVETSDGPEVANTNIQPPHLRTTNATETATSTANHRRDKHIRAVRMVGLIMGMFLLCWIPFSILMPIISYCPECVSVLFVEYAFWAAYFNSFINPILYFISNADFHKALKLIARKLIPNCTG